MARKLGRPTVENHTGRHKTNQIVGTENAEAWIETPLRAVLEKKPSEGPK
jgi:hypothetical protein